MQTIEQLAALREAVDELRARGTVALVPTMGALHEGHMALVREAKARAAAVVVSIFVNPRQFGPAEDLASYPRTLVADSRMLEAEGVDLLWAPDADEVYPKGFSTTVSVAGVSESLCGAARPGHFDGVATVVLKLFNEVQPDLALFGEKDWQQLTVIRRMARDLDLLRPPAEAIHGVPTVREADGLALSSRNRYLSPDQREAARALPEVLQLGIAMLADGHALSQVRDLAVEQLLNAGFDKVDYLDLRDADTLEALEADNGNARLFVAAHIGGTRLIDNLAVHSRR